MLPRHLRAAEPGGPKPVLPASHRPEAAGTVSAFVHAPNTSSQPALEKFADAAGRKGSDAVRMTEQAILSTDDTDDTDEDASPMRCPQMAFVGARGRIPNLYWHAPDETQLRRHPRFVGLPHEKEIMLGHDDSYRFVRQGTELWDALHAGRLTTGCLTGALGFQEDGVSRSLGMGGRGGSHSPMVGAYHRLRQKPIAFDSGLLKTEENEANLEVVKKFNDQENALGPLIPVESIEKSNGDMFRSTSQVRYPKPKPNAKKKKKNNRNKQIKTQAVDENVDTVNSNGLNASQHPYHAWLSRRDPHSVASAQRGEGGIRMSWGSAQEHGTVATLMLHHPGSVAEEVGLCVVDHDLIPEQWNVGPLPPLGASPDGIITMDTTWFRGATRKNKKESKRERLIVEVKNSSPFRKQFKGGGNLFEVSDRDPHDFPPPYHMPQLQVEMLACNVKGGLLCMQSATRGVRVFFVQRDDDYCAAMLGILSDLYTQFVLPGVEPPPNAFTHRSDHRALVRATKRIATNCVLIQEIAHLQLPGEAYDMRPFL